MVKCRIKQCQRLPVFSSSVLLTRVYPPDSTVSSPSPSYLAHLPLSCPAKPKDGAQAYCSTVLLRPKAKKMSNSGLHNIEIHTTLTHQACVPVLASRVRRFKDLTIYFTFLAVSGLLRCVAAKLLWLREFRGFPARRDVTSLVFGGIPEDKA